MGTKTREPDVSTQAAPRSRSQVESAEQTATDLESVSESTSPARGESNSAVDAPNAHDPSVLPDEVVSADDRTIPRASDLDSAGSLNAPDDMRDMTA